MKFLGIIAICFIATLVFSVTYPIFLYGLVGFRIMFGESIDITDDIFIKLVGEIVDELMGGPVASILIIALSTLTTVVICYKLGWVI